MSCGNNGSVLIELIVATTLISLAGSAFHSGLSHAVRVQKTLYQWDIEDADIRFFWLAATGDLRNAAVLKKHPFRGKKEKIEFPSSDESVNVRSIVYEKKGDRLIRTQTPLPGPFRKGPVNEEIMISSLESFKIEFAYLDSDEHLVYKPEWPEEPYFGLPKAIKISFKKKDSQRWYSKLISIPQGKWGHES